MKKTSSRRSIRPLERLIWTFLESKRPGLRHLTAGLSTTLAFGASFGQAATAPPAEEKADSAVLEAVVVTATRQKSTTSKVPASISASTQETLDKQGVKSFGDVARLTPGLAFQPSDDPMTNSVSIRGIRSTVGAATTGIYIDDTPIQVRLAGPATENVYPTIFDLERVEVLRGPQGTLFGSGSMGGTIRFITPEPSLYKYTGYSRAGVEFTEHGSPSFELGTAVGGPISEGKLGFRASAFVRRDGGWVDRASYPSGEVTQKDANSARTESLRLAVGYQATDALTITPSVLYQRVQQNGSAAFWDVLSNPDEGQFRNGAPSPQENKNRFVLPALNVHWEGPGFEVISNTAYFDRSMHRTVDYSSYLSALLAGIPLSDIPGYYASSIFDVGQKNLTQEVRVQSLNTGGRWNWVVGAFFENAKLNTKQYVEDPYLPAFSQKYYGVSVKAAFGKDLIDGLYSFVGDRSAYDRQTALFGQVDYKVTDKLTATVGLRVTRASFGFDAFRDGPLTSKLVNSEQTSETPVTPKLGVAYQLDPANMVYASVAKGYRIGGANSPPNNTPGCAANLAILGLSEVPASYQSDNLWSYELGMKNALAGGAVQVESSVYYIDWSNMQKEVALTGCGSSFVANVGAATSTGFDVALRAQATKALAVSLGLGYTKAKYSKTLLVGANKILVAEGDSLGVSPLSLTLSAEYKTKLFGYDGFLRGDYSYAGRNRDNTPGRDPSTVQFDPSSRAAPSVSLLSLRAAAKVGRAEVALFADNVLGTAPIVSRSHDALGIPLYSEMSVRPRTVGVTLSHRF